jgi:hypothetical protein
VKIIVIIIALAMFLKPILPVAEYAINYDYISKVLCINKEKPKLQCNGKCHLMKEMAKASENEKPINSNKKDNSKQEIEVLFFQNLPSLLAEQIYFDNTTSIGNHYSNLYFHMNSCSVFHPPTIIS